MAKILLTGAAGFIGFSLAKKLATAHDVVGLDNLGEYYDVRLKHARLDQLKNQKRFRFVKMDLADRGGIAGLFKAEKFDRVVHLGAQVGVRYSLQNPHAYIDSNIVGTANILEGCRHFKVAHLVYASSSSIYGLNTKMPYSVHHNADHPVSLYAATKRSTELMAHTYSHLYGIPTTGLRFFTVYGPWGRPDMAYFLFAKAILEGKPIDVFNEGNIERDFTYVDDIVEGILRIIEHAPRVDSNWSSDSPDPATSSAPYRIYNIGNNNPIKLGYFIECLENALGKKAIKRLLPMQPGDLLKTYADIGDLERDFQFKPSTPIEEGLGRFVEWYLQWRT
jgi:UDP-glucuronate 4-epimerase